MNEIRRFYFKNETNESAVDAYVDLGSDMNFAYFVEKIARIQAKISTGNTFFYRFSVEAILNRHRSWGAAHADELCYLFRYFLVVVPLNR